MFTASGSEEWLPKLLLSYLVFGRRKVVLNWLWAVMMWGLTLGRKSWKDSPAFWFKRIQCGGLGWGCFGCLEQVLGGGVQKWPWWAQSVLVAVLWPRISTQICVGHIGPQILHLVTFIMAEFPLFFKYYCIFHFHGQWGSVLLVFSSPLTLVPSLPRLKYPVNLHTQDVQWYHVPMSLHMSRSSWGQGRFNLKLSYVAIKYFRILLFVYCADSKMMGLLFYEKLRKAYS